MRYNHRMTPRFINRKTTLVLAFSTVLVITGCASAPRSTVPLKTVLVQFSSVIDNRPQSRPWRPDHARISRLDLVGGDTFINPKPVSKVWPYSRWSVLQLPPGSYWLRVNTLPSQPAYEYHFDVRPQDDVVYIGNLINRVERAATWPNPATCSIGLDFDCDRPREVSRTFLGADKQLTFSPLTPYGSLLSTNSLAALGPIRLRVSIPATTQSPDWGKNGMQRTFADAGKGFSKVAGPFPIIAIPAFLVATPFIALAGKAESMAERRKYQPAFDTLTNIQSQWKLEVDIKDIVRSFLSRKGLTLATNGVPGSGPILNVTLQHFALTDQHKNDNFCVEARIRFRIEDPQSGDCLYDHVFLYSAATNQREVEWGATKLSETPALHHISFYNPPDGLDHFCVELIKAIEAASAQFLSEVNATAR